MSKLVFIKFEYIFCMHKMHVTDLSDSDCYFSNVHVNPEIFSLLASLADFLLRASVLSHRTAWDPGGAG